MGADHPIVLEPRCPATEDPGILSFMRLAKTLTQASWVELELRPIGTSSSQTYRSGSGTGKAITLPLEAGIEFDASLRLGRRYSLRQISSRCCRTLSNEPSSSGVC